MEIGLSEYEARAYITLLSTSPATAYEVAREAGLPSSKVYQVLDKLMARNMIQSIEERDKKRYLPLGPDEFISGQKKRIETTLASLKSDLGMIKKEPDVSYIWNVKEYQYLMEKAERMVRLARKEILLSTWSEELADLSPSLRKSEQKGLNIAIVHFGPASERIGIMYHHPIEETICAEKGGRGFTLVADSREAIMATVQMNTGVEGAWSMNAGFVTLAEDYIKHDIYIMKIVSRFDKLLMRRFGPGYRRLRDIYSDREERYEKGKK